MSTFGNIIWHFPFLGFIHAAMVYLLGLLLTATVIAAPIGLGLMELGKFLFKPFSNVLVDQRDLNVTQNQAWKTYSTIVTICYFPFGLLLAIYAVFQIGILFVFIVTIPVGIVIAKSLRTYLNPVGKKCVPNAVGQEIERRRGQQQIAKHFGSAAPEPELVEAIPMAALPATAAVVSGPVVTRMAPAPERDPPAALAAPAAASAPVCPVCGTENPPGSKFCRKDGTRLADVTAATAPPSPPPAPPKPQMPAPVVHLKPAPVESEPEAVPSNSKFPLPAIAAVAAVILLGGGFYLYWSGTVGNRQASVATKIQSDLAAAGLTGVTVQVDKAWVATVGGMVVGQDEHDRALARVRGNSSLKTVVDSIAVSASPEELKAMVERVLVELGLAHLRVDVEGNSAVALSGMIESDEQRNSALSSAQRLPGVVTVVDRLERSVLWRQRDANQMLAGAGLTLVTASYLDETSVALNGQVSASEARAQAEQVMNGVDANARIVNNIQVVLPPPTPVVSAKPRKSDSGPTSAAAAAPPPEPVRPVAESILGAWHTANVSGSTAAKLQFTDLTPGNKRAGNVEYTKTGCKFRLEFIRTQDNVLEYRERQSNTLKALMCGTGAALRIELSSPTQAVAQASNPNTGRVLGSVELVRE